MQARAPQSLKGTTRLLYFCLLMFFTSAAVVCQTKMECQPEWWLLTSSVASTEHDYSISYMKLREVKVWRATIIKENCNFYFVPIIWTLFLYYLRWHSLWYIEYFLKGKKFSWPATILQTCSWSSVLSSRSYKSATLLILPYFCKEHTLLNYSTVIP